MNLKTTWSSLEPNERRLITIAAVLSFVFVGYQFVLSPALDMRERAARGYASSIQTQSDIVAMTRDVTRQEQEGSRSGLPLQAIVSDTSAVYGLSISRMAPVDSDNLNLWLDGADSQTLFFWLSDLSDNQGVKVSRILVRRDNEGKVSANMLVTRTS